MRLPIPKAVLERMQPAIQRGERFLKEWEWTWTNATIVGLAISWFSLVTLAFVPSWFLYFADNTLGWDDNRLLISLRDMVAMGQMTTFFVAIIVVAYFLQKIRRRLRGEGDSRPSGGYR